MRVHKVVTKDYFLLVCCKCDEVLEVERSDVKYEVGGCSHMHFNDPWITCCVCSKAQFVSDCGEYFPPNQAKFEDWINTSGGITDDMWEYFPRSTHSFYK